MRLFTDIWFVTGDNSGIERGTHQNDYYHNGGKHIAYLYTYGFHYLNFLSAQTHNFQVLQLVMLWMQLYNDSMTREFILSI